MKFITKMRYQIIHNTTLKFFICKSYIYSKRMNFMHKNPPVITTLDIHYMVINLWDDTVLPRLFRAHKRIKNAQPNRLSICSVIDLLNLTGVNPNAKNIIKVAFFAFVKSSVSECQRVYLRRCHLNRSRNEHLDAFNRRRFSFFILHSAF